MIELNIILIAVFTASAAALSGVFLVLRKMSLMSDAISHAVLPGIVVAFLITRDLQSPFLIVGAAATGLVMVFIIELINKTKLVKEDAAIGLVFPALFSIGVILISQNLSDVHLCEETVLTGDIVLSSINSIQLFGVDIGPKSMYVMAGLLLINIVFISLFFKELKLSTFDPLLASSLGFNISLINYSFMAIVSVTAVGAFDSVGSILVIALMIAPAVSACLLTDKLKMMLLLSVLFGIVSAIFGFYISVLLNSSPSGSMAMTAGFLFLLVYLFAPVKGIVAVARRKKRHNRVFSQKILALHIAHHSNTCEEEQECCEETIYNHIFWDKRLVKQIVEGAKNDKLVVSDNGILKLTPKGQEFIALDIIL